MKNKLILLCWIAISIAAAAIIISIFKVVPTVNDTGETYTGVLVTLLGIVITFVVAYQLYNVFDFKQRVENLEKLGEDLTTIKGELEKESHALEDFKYQIRAEIINGEGVNAKNRDEFILASCLFMSSLYNSLKCNNAKSIETALFNVKSVLLEWDTTKPKKPADCSVFVFGMHPRNEVVETMNQIATEFNGDKLYELIENQFLDIKWQLETKLKEYEETKK